jgi:hypothetical protein
LTSTKNLKQARAKIVASLAKVIATAKVAKQAAQVAGTPTVPNGEKIAGVLNSGLDQATKVFVKAKAQAAKISTKNESAFTKQATKVISNLQSVEGTLRNQVLSAVTLDTGGQIQAAALTAPECAFIAGS